MKLRLLKPLPGAEVGTILKEHKYMKRTTAIPLLGTVNTYDIDTLISTGWAEEIKEPERWEPKLRETYFKYAIYTENCHPISECKSFESVGAEKKMAEYGLVAKTREELETTLLLLKLRQSNGGWKPKDRENYFAVTINGYVSTLFYASNNSERVNDLLTGNCYRTSEEAEKYAPEWKKLFDSVK